MKLIEKALEEGRNTLSEYESKQLLAAYQIPVTREVLVDDMKDLTTLSAYNDWTLAKV